jgi:hypothetical protein
MISVRSKENLMIGGDLIRIIEIIGKNGKEPAVRNKDHFT